MQSAPCGGLTEPRAPPDSGQSLRASCVDQAGADMQESSVVLRASFGGRVRPGWRSAGGPFVFLSGIRALCWN